MSRSRPDRSGGARRDPATRSHPYGAPLVHQTRRGRRAMGLVDRARGPWAARPGEVGLPTWSTTTPRSLSRLERVTAATVVFAVLAALLLLAVLVAVVVIVGDVTAPAPAPPPAPDPAPTAVVTPPAGAESRRASRTRRTVARRRAPDSAYTAFLACTRRHESDTAGGYRAVSPTGRFRGAYQFDAATWRSVGGTGDPAAAAPAEQDRRAVTLARRRGAQPWGGRCAGTLP